VADAFISYVEEDGALAARISSVLGESGISSWRYETDAVAGRNYLLQTREAIEGCGVFVVVLSKGSLPSEQVDREIVRAHECGKPFLPVLHGVTYADYGRRRPSWQQAMGAVTAVAVPDGDASAVRGRLVEGARAAIGAAGGGSAVDPERTAWPARVRRRLRSWRTWRLAAVVLAGIALAAYALDARSRARRAEGAASVARAKHTALQLVRTGYAGDARGVLEGALAIAPEDGELHTLAGWVRHELGDSDAALAHLDRRVRDAPRDGLALWLRGRVHERLGHADAALADLRAAIGSSSLSVDEYVDACHGRALLLLDRNEPEHPLRLALTAERTGELKEAERDFTTIFERRGWTGALLDRGRVRSWLSLEDDARRDLREAYRRAVAPGMPADAASAAKASYELGVLDLRVALRENRWQEVSSALEWFDASLVHDPASVPARIGRALSRTGLGAVEDGARDLERILQGMSPADPHHAHVSGLVQEVRTKSKTLPVQDLALRAVPPAQGADRATFLVSCRFVGRKGVPCRFVLQVYERATSPYLHLWQPVVARHGDPTDGSGNLAVVRWVTPTEDDYPIEDMPLEVPYEMTPLYNGPQRYEVTLRVADPQGTVSTLVTGHFSFTVERR
jgi:tetratricopeptide (TPR) repeat protein